MLLAAPLLHAAAAAQTPGVNVLRAAADSVEVIWTAPAPALREMTIGDRRFPALQAEGMTARVVSGEPASPERRLLIELPDDGDVDLITATEGETVRALRVPPVPAGNGIPDAAEPRLRKFAELSYVGWMREHRVACVRVAPALVDEATGTVRTAARLRLTLRVHGGGAVGRAAAAPLAGSPADGADQLYRSAVCNPWSVSTGLGRGPLLAAGVGGGSHASIQSGPQTAPSPANGSAGSVPFTKKKLRARIEVNAEGMYQITYGALAALGVNMSTVSPKQLTMTRGGQTVAIEVQGEADGKFDVNDRVIFFGAPIKNNIYASTQVYWLEESLGPLPAGARMGAVDGTPNAQLPTPISFRDTFHSEFNSAYFQNMPNNSQPDHWFWLKALAPTTSDYTLLILDPVPTGAPCRVRANMFGYTNPTQNPDHHTKVSLNSTLVSDDSWDGIVLHLQDHTAPASLLMHGNNTVRLQQVNDTGALVDGVYTDWFEIEYDRYFNSFNDSLIFQYTSAQPVTFAVSKFTSPSIRVADITAPDQPVRVLNGAVSTANGSSALSVTAAPAATGSRYIAVADSALLAPASITAAGPSFVAPAAGADLIILVPHALRASIDPLAAQRTAQGWRVAVVESEQMFDAFGNGVKSPDGILAFLANAYSTWTAPAPSALLLVGEASVDYLGYLGNPGLNQIPTTMRASVQEGEVPTDYKYACLVGNDPLPELFVGRISADAPTEVTNVVQKILMRENGAPAGPWKTTVLHVADKANNFAATLDTLGNAHVPPAYTITKTYYDNYPTSTAMKAAMIASLSSGACVSTFLGHGAPTNLGSFFGLADVASLANTDKTPLQLALNCTAGYFASPTTPQCVGEEMLVRAQSGCAAFFGSVSLGFLSQLTPIASYTYDRVFAGQTLGSATTGGKLDAYLNAGILEDNLWEVQLLGDPAAKVLPP